MKRILLAVLSAALLIAMIGSSAMAAPPSPRENGKDKGPRAEATPSAASKDARRGVAGFVQNKGNDAFDVVTRQGTVRVTVDSNKTRIKVKGKPNATFADVANGNRVNVNGTLQDGKLAARWVHVVSGKPSNGHVVGRVKSFAPATSSGNGSIVITDVSGADRTFVVIEKTKLVLPGTASSLQVNDWVTVVATKDSTPTARGIALYQKQS